ncbi:MAG: FG-GAP-like repeat-containing protein, partial [Bacteroidetes bacterium]|nr:FG-GAP-like repeat-containing protein [Bacteroidota bacterium]
PVGLTTVTWTVFDLAGNSATCTQNVTVTDDEAPVITVCPTDRNIAANSSDGFTMLDYTSEVTASDNCTFLGDLIITQSPLAGDTVFGNQVVTISIEDQSGNLTTCQFALTLNVFTDVALESGIDYAGKTFGSSWADMDGNGFMDLYMSCHSNAGESYLTNDIPRFFYNQNGTFTSQELGGAFIQNDWHGGSFFDHDNDGNLDFYAVTGGNSGNVLIEDLTGPTYSDSANERGLSYSDSRGRTATPCDVNDDGYTDIILSCLSNGSNSSTLFLNQAGNGFTNAGQSFLFPVERSIFTSLMDMGFSGEQNYVLMENTPKIYSIENGVFVLKTSLSGPRTQSFVLQDFNGDLLPDAFLTRGIVLPEAVQVNDTLIRAMFEYAASTGPMEISFQTSGDLLVEFSPFYNQFVLQLGSDSLAYYTDKLTLDFSPTSPSSQGLQPIDPFTAFEHIYLGHDSLNGTWTLQITHASEVKEKFGIEVRSTAPIQNLATQNFVELPESKDLLYFNNGDGTFTAMDQSISFSNENGLAVLSGDLDNDMDVDLYVVNSGFAKNTRNILMENDGQGNFTRHEDAWGAVWDGDGIAESATLVDYDNDGFLDLYVCNGRDVFFLDQARPNLYRNRGNGNHWIKLSLKGLLSNPMGLHSRVKVYTEGKVQARYQDGGLQKFSQNDSRLHFGLGSNTAIDSITVDWPSGIHQVIIAPAIDQIMEITEDIETVPLCQSPNQLAIVELGFGTNNPLVRANWNNPESTSECEVRGGRISAATISSEHPEFQNLVNTRIIDQTNGSSVNFGIKLYNNPNINFVTGSTYGYEARCRCAISGDFSAWSGLSPGSLFTVPFPPGSLVQGGAGKSMNVLKANIYPNPSTGHITIDSPFQMEAIQVFDLLGRSIEYQIEDMTSLPTSNLSMMLGQGIYIIRLQGLSGETEVHQVVVF